MPLTKKQLHKVAKIRAINPLIQVRFRHKHRIMCHLPAKVKWTLLAINCTFSKSGFQWRVLWAVSNTGRQMA
jgi:hypothetical protein